MHSGDFSGIFTPQGKYLYEFFIIKNKNGYLLDCHIEIKDDLVNHLLKYTLHYNSVHYYFTNEEYYAKCR